MPTIMLAFDRRSSVLSIRPSDNSDRKPSRRAGGACSRCGRCDSILIGRGRNPKKACACRTLTKGSGDDQRLTIGRYLAIRGPRSRRLPPSNQVATAARFQPLTQPVVQSEANLRLERCPVAGPSGSGYASRTI